ncbi:MAG: TlpA family protein disulfide reductase [Thermoanaerobaculia bacterium]|nr:MAG: TlpA family protein disulfide reductase [Thermoanaerobaculia bacterium]MBZ0101677.1 TlpA family protein disulfide reductase [Thermoanaerobaculia bacterium]
MRHLVLPLALFVALPLAASTGEPGGAAETDQRGAVQAWQGPSAGYTVIDFAASWCRPCWAVLPRLEAFATEHPEIRVVAVSVDDAVSGRDLLVAKLHLTIPVLWDGRHRIAEHYRPAAMPSTFVLDPSGAIVYRHTGSTLEDWDAMVAFLADATKR